MRDMSAENSRHEEEIPVLRSSRARHAERANEEASNGDAPCLETNGSRDLEEVTPVEGTVAEEECGAGTETEDEFKEARIAELEDANLRVRADFENFRRRAAKQRLEIAEHAKAELARRLLPVLDNLERALETAEEQSVEGSWVEGLRMVHSQFLAALKEEGIEPIEALGVEFDPNLHEAVATMPHPIAPKGVITAEVSRGYRLGSTVLRASQVVTSSGAPDDSEEVEDAKEEF